MKFIAMIKSDAAAEAGEMPDAKFMSDMGAFNNKMVEAKVMLSGEGLHPSSAGARLNFSTSGVTTTPGPFPNPTELVAGFWLLECASLDEAISWMKQCPLAAGAPMEIEIRRLFTAEDFAPPAS